MELGPEVLPSESPHAQDQFQHEQATEDQPRNAQCVPHVVPFGIGVFLVTLVEVDDDVGEDAEEIKGDEREDGIVLRGGREEGLNLGAADGVGSLVKCDVGMRVIGGRYVGVWVGVGGEERLGATGRRRGGHGVGLLSDSGYCWMLIDSYFNSAYQGRLQDRLLRALRPYCGRGVKAVREVVHEGSRCGALLIARPQCGRRRLAFF